MKYAYYLFDFDGTIADTGEGIRRSVAYSAEQLGYPVQLVPGSPKNRKITVPEDLPISGS